jgi:RNA polymerase sigma-70 factor (ECF subfamily)
LAESTKPFLSVQTLILCSEATSAPVLRAETYVVNDSPQKSVGSAKDRSDRELSPELADAEMLILLALGQQEAFWHLWCRHKAVLHQICLREMNGNFADAEDALSQVMLRALDRLPRCVARIQRVQAWLKQMARNLCSDLRRKNKRRYETTEYWAYTDSLTATDYAALAMPTKEVGEIQHCITTLPPLLRAPFVLNVIAGSPSKAVAAQLGLSPANVRKRVQLARARLQSELEFSQTCGDDLNSVAQTTLLELPAVQPCDEFKPSEIFLSVKTVSTVCVRLPCGIDRLFHIFHEKAPLARGGKIKSIQDHLAKHPRSWKKRLELAQQFYEAGDWAKAVDEWQRVTEQRLFLPVVFRLGETLLNLGQADVAAKVFVRARGDPVCSTAIEHHLNGWIAICSEDVRGAILEFQSAVELEPLNPVHLHRLALAHWLAGSTPEALLAIERALNLNPNDLVALSQGHEMLVIAGHLEQALERAQRLSR